MTRTKPKIWTAAEQAAWQTGAGLTPTQWADTYRNLDPVTSAEGGPYRSDRTPYMRKPMDAFGDRDVEEIDIMSGAQISKSTSLQNMIAWAVDEDPGPALYLVPREKDVGYVSQIIFKQMVLLSPRLRRHVSGSPRDLQTEQFTFDSMPLYFGWAGSPAEVAQRAIRYLFEDEPDKYPEFIGKQASPVVDQAETRTTTFYDFKIVRACTPSTTLGAINVNYLESNMQEYYPPCPHCGQFRIWLFSQLRKPDSLVKPSEIIEQADVWMECEICHYKIFETEKPRLVDAGLWVPAGQTINKDGAIRGTPNRSKRHSGFHLSSLVSPFPKMSWPRVMARFVSANTEQGIITRKLVHFKNEIEGEPFEESAVRLKKAELEPLKAGHSRGTVPAEAFALVASADYHKSLVRKIVRIDYQVTAFGYGSRNWLVSTGSVASFEELDKAVLLSPFPWADGTPNEEKPWLPVTVMPVDSGYEPDDVYEYCRQRPGLTIPTKGLPGPRTKPLQVSRLEDVTFDRLSAQKRRRYRGMQLLLIDTYYFKNLVTGWLESQRNEAGSVVAEPSTEFFREVPDYYLKELTNEQKVMVYDKAGNYRYVWRPVTKGAPTHSLDLFVLVAAAAQYKRILYIRKPGDKPAPPAAGRQQQPRKKAAPPKDNFLDNMPKLTI